MTIIAQLTDLHICAPGELAYGRVDTTAHLIAAVDHLNALRPDGIVITGDLVDHGTAEEYVRLRPMLDRLDAPWWPIPGNHDGVPFWDVLADRMTDRVRDVGHVVDLPGLRIVLLDTRVPGASHGDVTPDRAAWLASVLDHAGPTLLAMHHPPFATGIAHMDRIGLRGAGRLAAAVAARPPLAILCGHVHRTVIGSFKGIPARIAPSCAHAVALDLTADGPARLVMEPPGIALHHIDADRLVSHVSPVGGFGGQHPFVGFDPAPSH